MVKFMDTLQIGETPDPTSFLVCEGSKMTILSDRFPGVELDSNTFSIICSKAKTEGNIFMRRLVEHFFSLEKIASHTRESFEKDEHDTIQAIYGNFFSFFVSFYDQILVFGHINQLTIERNSVAWGRGSKKLILLRSLLLCVVMYFPS